MFCAECGKKNKNDSQFCEHCGHKLENEQTKKIVKTKPQVSKNSIKREMSKKNKIILAIVAVIVAALAIIYFILNNMTKPSTIAEKFFNATMSYDAEAMYEYLDVVDSEFTTKEVFKKIIDSIKDEDDMPTVVNYTVGKPVPSTDKLSTTVTITYVLKNSDKSKTLDVKLVKDKNKKWLMFDNWKVNVSGFDIVKDYEIKVMKGSKVKVEGIEVSSKYLDKKKSDESFDVYTMPAMYETNYNIVVTLPIGIDIEDKMRVSEGNSYTYSLSLDNLTDEVKKKIQDSVKSSLQTLYDGAKDKKSFDDIKSSFEYKDADLSDLKDAYEKLVENISSDITLTSVTYNDVTLSRVSINSEGNLYVSTKVSYNYSLTYQSGEETKTNDSKDTDYVYLTFDYADDTFKLIDVSSLNTYFSKYY